MRTWLEGEILNWQGTVKLAASLLALVFVAAVYARSRSFVALLVALLTAGIFIWGINNVSWFQKKVGEEAGPQVSVPPLPVRFVGGHPRCADHPAIDDGR